MGLISRKHNLLAPFGPRSKQLFHGPKRIPHGETLPISFGGHINPIHPVWGLALVLCEILVCMHAFLSSFTSAAAPRSSFLGFFGAMAWFRMFRMRSGVEKYRCSRAMLQLAQAMHPRDRSKGNTNPTHGRTTNPIRIHEARNPRVHESTNPRIHESTSPRIHESTNPRVHESTNLRIHESTNPRVPHVNTIHTYHVFFVRMNRGMPRVICIKKTWYV